MIKRLLQTCRRWSEHELALVGLVAVTLLASFYRGYGFSNNSYAIASWLVTYEGGFIKRGLIGTILQLEQISGWTGIPVPDLFFALTNGLLVGLHVLVGLLLLAWIRRDTYAVLLIPYFLTGPLLRVQSVWIGNIDHLLAILMIALVYCLVQRKIIAAGIIAVTGIFIHEIIFAMVFPVFIFYLLLEYRRDKKMSHQFRQATVALGISMLCVAGVVLYQDIFLSGYATAEYIGDLVERQTEDNYNTGAISEVYATPFYTWFLSQKDDFFARITDSGLFAVVLIPAGILLAVHGMATRRIARDPYLYVAAFFLVLSPLAVLLIAWDADRIWNLSVWTLFLLFWLLMEDRPCQRPPSTLLAGTVFLLSIPAFLMPQVRSNLDWGTCFLVYIPLWCWLILYLAGSSVSQEKADSAS